MAVKLFLTTFQSLKSLEKELNSQEFKQNKFSIIKAISYFSNEFALIGQVKFLASSSAQIKGREISLTNIKIIEHVVSIDYNLDYIKKKVCMAIQCYSIQSRKRLKTVYGTV